MDFKYTQIFSSDVKVVTPKEYCETLSLASLSDLKQLFPTDIDVDGNPDILLNAFNAAVANRINANDDGMSAKDALAISSKFIHKPTNIEHNRKQVVGHIVSQGFSQFGSNEVIAATEALASETSPFNIALGAVVWKTVDKDFAAELIESSDESSSKYHSISASWEIGFNNYNILLGHRDYSKGELITDPKQVEELTKYLRVKGGEGKMKDGVPVYRDILGGLPLGIGYTTSPAADVEGVIIKNDDTTAASKPEREVIVLSSYKPEENKSIIEFLERASKESEKSLAELSDIFNSFAQNGVTLDKLEEYTLAALKLMDEKSIDAKAAIQELVDTLKNIEKNVSQSTTSNVKDISIMEIKSTKDITDELFKETGVASSINKFIESELKKGSEQYADDFNKKKEEAQTLATQVSQLNTQLTETKDALKKIQEAQAAEKAEHDFNDRMTALNEAYNLGDKESEVIAKQIQGLNDEQYKAWFESFEVFASAKKKVAKTEDTTVASKQTTSAETVLENVTPGKTTTSVPNAAGGSEPTVFQKYSDAFSEKTITIKKNR